MKKHIMGRCTLNKVDNHGARVALVTGAGRRIGAEIAKHLHKAGFSVVIHCNTSHHDAHLLAERLNQQRANSARVLTADLSVIDSAHKLITDTLNWAGRLDVLVNNASIFTRDESTDWDTLFAINVKAPFLLSHAALKHIAKTGGSMINITDIHADKPLKHYAIYCQSKAALTLQTRALAREFAPTVRVNAVAPGAIMWPEHGNELSAALQQQIVAKTPLKRHGSPEFIAQAVLALIENDFITGQILCVDGGRSLT